jgi:D-serine deaminase-like pyridoxal phosphate-dependent protein
VDAEALGSLGAERIDWRFKGFPSAFHGRTAADLAAAGLALSDFSTPLLTLDAAALEHNLALMARYCADAGVSLAPHGKTTMAPQLFARQLEAGCWGITAATITHVRVYRAFGVPTVLMGNELIDPDALAWIAAEQRADPGFRFLCFADSVEAVDAMQNALEAAHAPRPIDVVLDLGLDGGRTGCRDLPCAERVARAVAAAGRLRLAGVGGFEGALAPDRSDESLQRIRLYLRFVRDVAAALDELGLFTTAQLPPQPAEILLTAGGSVYFDDVVRILTGAEDPAPESAAAGWKPSLPVRVVLRSGSYITHDDGHYRHLTPPFAGPGEEGFRAALRLYGRVLSCPEPGLALLDFGKRDAPADLGLPEPRALLRADGTQADLLGTGAQIANLADQHAFLGVPEGVRIAVGDLVCCGVSHPCTAFDKWQLIPVVRDGVVVDLVRTYF